MKYEQERKTLFTLDVDFFFYFGGGGWHFSKNRITDGMVFDRDSKSDFVIQKLYRLLSIYNYIMDCFELLNVTQTKTMFLTLIATATTLLAAIFGKYWFVLYFTSSFFMELCLYLTE